ncbi:2-methylisocitrate lyase [Candidatus Hydrogenisulfobacillus filiaventi]|uniref:Methylisocitrate lyase n=1 Tax=Candidatus Hydrogenisulfobacillus filiaventi TaxID=2707344 RepID=A0A6F8ZDV9_9FIRM|nr:2-methylisocitrate lyase [Candidatus Hydrogenisulfobacillus filiaventi]
MAWMEHPAPAQQELAARLAARWSRGPILQIPGAHDALTGLLARQAGFEALYLSGAAFTAARGLPDLGLIEGSEMADWAATIVAATGLPLLVDLDTGYGGVFNAARAARRMVAAGVAAVQIEDQELPKRCGHLDGTRLVPPEEMAAKVRAIKATAPGLLVVARTDARAVEGLEGAVARARRYLAAGADAIFPEALTSAEEFQAFARAVPAPLLANMTEFGKTPYFNAADFERWGYRMVLYPVSSLRVAAKAVERLFRLLRETGSQAGMLEAMQTRAELYALLGYHDYEAWDRRLAEGVPPADPAGS